MVRWDARRGLACVNCGAYNRRWGSPDPNRHSERGDQQSLPVALAVHHALRARPGGEAAPVAVQQPIMGTDTTARATVKPRPLDTPGHDR